MASAATAGRFIDLHILQSVPYSNLNRDDTNSVKTVQYGGVNRTRVSSQSWKRAMRLDVQRLLGQESLRTRRVAEALTRLLTDDRGWPADLARKAGAYTVVASSIGAEAPKKKAAKQEAPDQDANDDVPWGTKAMVYIPASAISELADIAQEYREILEAAPDAPDVKAKTHLLPTERINNVLRSRDGIINLFGRMLAELDDAQVDGAVQVAHALTTHQTDSEVDYFSAVDDITAAWRDSTGSAHMGHAEYSAGTFYRYVTIDIADLLRNLGGDVDTARTLTRTFLEAAVVSLPQAKKNSTAPHTFPDLIAVAVRADRPYSYAAAFEKPVPAGPDGGFADASVAVLDRYAGALAKLLGQRVPVISGHAGTHAKSVEGLGVQHDSLDLLLGTATDAAYATANQQ